MPSNNPLYNKNKSPVKHNWSESKNKNQYHKDYKCQNYTNLNKFKHSGSNKLNILSDYDRLRHNSRVLTTKSSDYSAKANYNYNTHELNGNIQNKHSRKKYTKYGYTSSYNDAENSKYTSAHRNNKSNESYSALRSSKTPEYISTKSVNKSQYTSRTTSPNSSRYSQNNKSNISTSSTCRNHIISKKNSLDKCRDESRIKKQITKDRYKEDSKLRPMMPPPPPLSRKRPNLSEKLSQDCQVNSNQKISNFEMKILPSQEITEKFDYKLDNDCEKDYNMKPNTSETNFNTLSKQRKNKLNDNVVNNTTSITNKSLENETDNIIIEKHEFNSLVEGPLNTNSNILPNSFQVHSDNNKHHEALKHISASATTDTYLDSNEIVSEETMNTNMKQIQNSSYVDINETKENLKTILISPSFDQINKNISSLQLSEDKSNVLKDDTHLSNYQNLLSDSHNLDKLTSTTPEQNHNPENTLLTNEPAKSEQSPILNSWEKLSLLRQKAANPINIKSEKPISGHTKGTDGNVTNKNSLFTSKKDYTEYYNNQLYTSNSVNNYYLSDKSNSTIDNSMPDYKSDKSNYFTNFLNFNGNSSFNYRSNQNYQLSYNYLEENKLTNLHGNKEPYIFAKIPMESTTYNTQKSSLNEYKTSKIPEFNDKTNNPESYKNQLYTPSYKIPNEYKSDSISKFSDLSTCEYQNRFSKPQQNTYSYTPNSTNYTNKVVEKKSGDPYSKQSSNFLKSNVQGSFQNNDSESIYRDYNQDENISSNIYTNTDKDIMTQHSPDELYNQQDCNQFNTYDITEKNKWKTNYNHGNIKNYKNFNYQNNQYNSFNEFSYPLHGVSQISNNIDSVNHNYSNNFNSNDKILNDSTNSLRQDFHDISDNIHKPYKYKYPNRSYENNINNFDVDLKIIQTENHDFTNGNNKSKNNNHRSPLNTEKNSIMNNKLTTSTCMPKKDSVLLQEELNQKLATLYDCVQKKSTDESTSYYMTSRIDYSKYRSACAMEQVQPEVIQEEKELQHLHDSISTTKRPQSAKLKSKRMAVKNLRYINESKDSTSPAVLSTIPSTNKKKKLVACRKCKLLLENIQYEEAPCPNCKHKTDVTANWEGMVTYFCSKQNDTNNQQSRIVGCYAMKLHSETIHVKLRRTPIKMTCN